MTKNYNEIPDNTLFAKEGPSLERIKKIILGKRGDIKVLTKEDPLSGIKAIITSASEPLSNMLSGHFLERSANEIDFSKYSQSAVYAFLMYIHVDEESFPEEMEDCFDLLELNEIYEQEKYSGKTVTHIISKIDVYNWLEVLSLCKRLLSISDSSKKKIMREARKVIFINYDCLLEKYFYIKNLIAASAEEETPENMAMIADRLDLAEGMIKDFLNSRVTINFDNRLPEVRVVTNPKVLSEHPNLIIMLRLSFSDAKQYYYSSASLLARIVSCDDYLLVKRTNACDSITLVIL